MVNRLSYYNIDEPIRTFYNYAEAVGHGFGRHNSRISNQHRWWAKFLPRCLESRTFHEDNVPALQVTKHICVTPRFALVRRYDIAFDNKLMSGAFSGYFIPKTNYHWREWHQWAPCASPREFGTFTVDFEAENTSKALTRIPYFHDTQFGHTSSSPSCSWEKVIDMIHFDTWT